MIALSIVGLAACAPPLAEPSPQITTIIIEQPSEVATPTPTPATWETTFARWGSGVARIASTGCDGTASGSGFLINEDTIVTAHHVVEGATAISLRFGQEVVAGETLAVDAEADLAIVRLTGAVSREVLHLADDPAAVGASVAALGYPFGEPLGMTQGAVTATDLRINVAGQDRWGMFRTDAAINPGNSGGPVVTIEGQVVGVVDAGSWAPGSGYAIGLPTLRAVLDAWLAGGLEPPSAPECEAAWGVLIGDSVVATASSTHPDAPSIAQTMQLYAESINTGYMEQVWTLLTPRMHERVGGIDNYAEGLSTSAWHWLDVEDVQVMDDTTDNAVVSFRTTQATEYGPDGATCTDWRVTYTLVLDAGSWQIDGAVLTDGVPPTPCVVDEPESGE